MRRSAPGSGAGDAAAGAQVIAVDIDARRLELARTLGADRVVDGSSTDEVAAVIREITGGGAHLSIDALGSRITCRNSILSLRKHGRHVQVGLAFGGESDPPVPMDRVVAAELEILGTHGMQAHRYGAVLRMVLSGRLQPGKLIGKRVPLEAAPAELAEMTRFGAAGITVIDRF